MCGILGVWRFDKRTIDVRNFHKSASSIRHRGPDDEGYLLVKSDRWSAIACKGPDSDASLNLPDIAHCYDIPISLALGFRRLSILDLSTTGHQPMSSRNGKYWIVYNGEIYNYVELRQELEGLGYQFNSTSDTEVLLTSYIHWGSDMLTRLVGMFAFAILDLSERRLFLARDFFGIKPLYYVLKHDMFAFASEAKALLGMGDIRRKLNPDAAYMYLRHGLTDYDETSLWKEINKLPPAHFFEICLDSPETIQPRRYWHLNFDKQRDISFSDAAAQLRDLFIQNVRLHLRSDVPVGAALSGGIDSAAIVSAMRRIQGGGLDLHTITYLADDPGLSEEKWADLAGQSADARIHKTVFSPENLVDDIDSLVYALDEPFGTTSIYAQYCVFRLAQQQHIKVMLDGQGADELMGGYASYLSAVLISLLSQGAFGQGISFLRRVWNRPDSGGMRILLRAGGLILPEAFRGIGYKLIGADLFPAWLNSSWFQKHNVEARSAISLTELDNKQALRSLLYQTFTQTSLPMLLRYEDHNSMVHSIESRVPFLTPAVVNFLFSLPEEYLIDNNGITKSVFRKAMRGIVPDQVLDRRDKIGFQTPERYLLTTLKPWVESVLDSPLAHEIPLINIEYFRRDYSQMLAGKKRFDGRIWRLINFIRWAEIFDVQF